MQIANLTQHPATAEQRAAGVADLPAPDRQRLADLLNFPRPPSHAEIRSRAAGLAALAKESGASAAMIGGAPYLMGALERALAGVTITPLYAFTQRESEEQTQPDGSVKKVAVFRHLGFVQGGATQ